MLWPRVDSQRWFLASFVALVALAWLSLVIWGRSPDARFLNHHQLGEADLSRPLEVLGLASAFVAAWTVMTVAMMLPTTLPLLTLFRRMIQRRQQAAVLIGLLVLGYLAVWSAFGVVAYAGDLGVHAVVNAVPWLEHRTWAILAAIFLATGVYQFTPLKYLCLDKCRSPMAFITERWHGRGQYMESLRLGLDHGLFCVGCCWSLMFVMFALGIGNVAWMLALGLLMGIEKNTMAGKHIGTVVGVALISAGIVTAFYGISSGASLYQ